MQGLTSSVPYELTLDDVKANSDHYHMATVRVNYALFVVDAYTEDNWTIRAFDTKGNLVADKLFGAEIRYMEQNR